MIEALLAFLFKYPPRVFARGDLVFAPVFPGWLLALVGIAAFGAIVYQYSRLTTLPRNDRFVLGGLRGLAVGLVLLALYRPTLVVSSAVPQRNVLAVLLDDSRSMRLTDVGEASRLTAVQSVFGDSTDLMKALSEQYVLRYFRFAADARPVTGAAALNGSGTRTDLAGALSAAREELSGTPVAGMVVISDGADNAGTDIGEALLGLRARRIPVYTVGVGRERFPRDIAIERVAAPASVLEGSNVLVDAAIRVRGLAGEQTEVSVEADGRIVATEQVRFPSSGDIVNARIRLPAMPPRTYRLTVRAATLENETITENNEYHTILHVRRGPERVLYFEGEPRPEFAFMRRSVAPDTALHLVGLLRTAEGKFLRLGVRDSMELLAGFPATREELFKYPALVLGSIEASFFTGDQLRMLSDFVSQRGGGLLVLGGRSAMAEGGFSNTALAEALPVALDRAVMDTGGPAYEVRVRPTNAGRLHPSLQLGATDSASARRWETLPPLTIVNGLGSLRPGATSLLTGRREDGGGEVPILAFHRFGRGVAAVFGVQDSWLWQMHADIEVEDETHETLWRQTLRWMLEGVPEQVSITAVPGRVGPGEPVALRARVSDARYIDVNDAAVTATVTTPAGRLVDVPLEWSLREDGTYTGSFVAEEAGVYAVVATSVRGRDTTASAPASLLADDHGADVENAELRTALLSRIARDTRGQYYTLDNVDRLVEDVKLTESGVTAREARDLWDMPVVLLLMIAALATEWSYRRWRGLA